MVASSFYALDWRDFGVPVGFGPESYRFKNSKNSYLIDLILNLQDLVLNLGDRSLTAVFRVCFFGSLQFWSVHVARYGLLQSGLIVCQLYLGSIFQVYYAWLGVPDRVTCIHYILILLSKIVLFPNYIIIFIVHVINNYISEG